MLTVIEAIAHMEGFYVPGSRAARNLNPGNLNFAPWLAKKYGAVLETTMFVVPPEHPRFARFKTVEDGKDAIRTLLTNPPYEGKSLSGIFNIYAPPSENQTNTYTAFVAHETGLSPDAVPTAAEIG